MQAALVTGLVRDQALNVGIALIAGVATLGVWNLAWRVLQIPMTAFGTVLRIGLPAMSRLVNAGEDPRPVIERGGATLAVLAGTLMVALVGFAPAVPAVVGEGWESVPSVLLFAGVTLIATFPLHLGTVSFLFASDAGGTVLRATAAGAVVWLAVALPLLPALGAPAAGIGWCAGGLLQVVIVSRSAVERTGAALARTVVLPTAIGIAAAVGGWLTADAAGGTIGAGVLGAATGELVLFAALAVLRRPALRDARAVMGVAIGNVKRRDTAPA
jgi:O-antigen/teichoic acid export membrane protein